MNTPVHFEEMDNVATATSMEEAVEKWYRRERRSDPEARDAIIHDRIAGMAKFGFVCLASRHESVTGHALWARAVGDLIGIYQ